MNNYGFLIILEGLDYSGKSTVAQKTKDALTLSGYDVLIVSDLRSTDLGKDIASIHLNASHKDMNDTSRAMLICAARKHLIETVIRPALNEGRVVIYDRSWFSTMVYQDKAEGLNILNDLTVGALHADRIIKLEIDYDTYQQRVNSRPEKKDWLDSHSEERWCGINMEMDRLLKHHAIDNIETVFVVDANGDVDTVFDKVFKLVIDTINIDMNI